MNNVVLEWSEQDPDNLGRWRDRTAWFNDEQEAMHEATNVLLRGDVRSVSVKINPDRWES